MCSSKDKGADARKLCKNACIGCKKCEKSCEAGAVTVTDNLARIDREKCNNCGKCAEVCPTKCIREFIL
jgi:ferredoxin